MIRLLSGHHPAANPSLLLPLCPAAGQRGRGGEGLLEAQLPHVFQDGVSPFAPGAHSPSLVYRGCGRLGPRPRRRSPAVQRSMHPPPIAATAQPSRRPPAGGAPLCAPPQAPGGRRPSERRAQGGGNGGGEKRKRNLTKPQGGGCTNPLVRTRVKPLPDRGVGAPPPPVFFRR